MSGLPLTGRRKAERIGMAPTGAARLPPCLAARLILALSLALWALAGGLLAGP